MPLCKGVGTLRDGPFLGARGAQSSTNAIGQGREPDAPAALGEASPDRVYGMVGQLAGCGWSMRIPVFGVPAGR